MIEDIEKQEQLEAHLLHIWAQDCPETKTVEELFGSYESWLLPLGMHLLLLHPVLKEWLYFDQLHETWERTGFGPGEAVFVAEGKLLGFRRQQAYPLAEEAPSQLSDLEAAAAKGRPGFLCPHCGHANPPGNAFCSQCGAPLQVSRPAVTVQSQHLICPACNHQNAPGKKFCTQCGAPLG